MIRNLSFSTFFTFTFFLFVSTPTSAKEPENLHKLKQAVIFYHDSGEYAYDQEAVAERARDYLDTRINQNKNNQKLAIVFDIDETALSNYQHMLSLNFGMIPQLVVEHIEKAGDPAIEATFKLYQYAKEKGVVMKSLETLLKKTLNPWDI